MKKNSLSLSNRTQTMNYAYIRVSTELQSYEGQKFEIEHWCKRKGIQIDCWVKEKISGTQQLNRRTLGKLLRKMKPGDMLVCTELSRLGRNMMMVMSILNTCSQQDIRIYSIKDNFELSDSLNSKIIAFAFSLAAEIERNLISQRTREALAAKKEAGVRLGRPEGSSRQMLLFKEKEEEIYQKWMNGYTIEALSKELGVHRNTLSRYLKKAFDKE